MIERKMSPFLKSRQKGMNPFAELGKRAMAHLDVEEFRILLLDAQLHLIKEEILQRGTADQVCVHPREVSEIALENGACAVVLFHNHPDGHAKPSKIDRVVTAQIIDALRPLNIRVYDHIIIAGTDFFSFRDAGLIKYPEDVK